MIVLVANLGSTSFKYKLLDMTQGETVLAAGAADRIGQGRSAWSVTVGTAAQKVEGVADLPDHAAAIELHLRQLVQLGAVANLRQLDAIGFKAVHGGPIGGAAVVDEKVIAIMEQFTDVAPQHNPPYIAAMRAFAKLLPQVPQVAAFETAFHQTIPACRQLFGIPHEWVEKLGVRRYGFHGASHRYIAVRMHQLAPAQRKIISCHLGGSCSLCALQDGRSVANSFGMTTQTGVFHASRVGDFDVFAVSKLLQSGLDLRQILTILGKDAGLKGLSGISADMREVEQAAAAGNARARLALDAFVDSVRQYLGAYLAVLNGADAIVFTGGIGQHGKAVRAAVCAELDFAGIRLDPRKNEAARGNEETRIDAADSKAAIWVLPTNEELIVARQVVDVLRKNN